MKVDYNDNHRSAVERLVAENFIKKTLEEKIFVATYQERQFCSQLSTYKDVITVNNDEYEFLKDLEVVMEKLRSYYNEEEINTCIATESTDESDKQQYKLFTVLANVPIGVHWFTIKSMKFYRNQIVLNIKQLRPFTSDCARSSKQSSSPPDISELFNRISLLVLNTLYLMNQLVTLPNMIHAARFLVVFTIVTANSLYSLFELLSTFSLKFMGKLAKLIRALSPIVIALIDAGTRIIGGIFMFIFMALFNKKRVPIMHGDYNNHYRDKSYVTFNNSRYRNDSYVMLNNSPRKPISYLY